MDFYQPVQAVIAAGRNVDKIVALMMKMALLDSFL
jgi:hypothetical protein